MVNKKYKVCSGNNVICCIVGLLFAFANNIVLKVKKFDEKLNNIILDF